MSKSSTRLQVFYDITRTVHSGGRMGGVVRVESEFGAGLLQSHSDSVIPIAWSSSGDRFVEIDRATALAYLSGERQTAEVAGPPVDVTTTPAAGIRRIVVSAGGGWLSNLSLLHGLLHLKRRLGAELQVVVHDVIHLRYPQWVPGYEALRTASAHEAMLCTADRLLAYSASTTRDVVAACAERTLPISDITSVSLGTAFVPASARADGLEELAGRPFVLYVSSVAARKNHQFIAEVWRRLAAELGDRLPRLLFVGRAASDQQEALERMERDPALADHLVRVSGASDAQLAWLYEHCRFTVFPSLYEGWGLPVAESLSFGKVCLASNAGAIPEAAAGVTPVLDPLDVVAWCATIRTLVQDPGELSRMEARVREAYRPLSWPDAARRFWAAVTAPLTSTASPPVLDLSGEPRDVALVSVTRQPWRPVRDSLGRVTAHGARVGLILADLPPHGIRLSVAMRNDDSQSVRIEPAINGEVQGGLVVRPSEDAISTMDLPRDFLLQRGLLDLAVTCRSAERPRLSLITVGGRPLSADEEAAALVALGLCWPLGESLEFTAGSRHLVMLETGWGEPARWGVWTVKPSATLSFRAVPEPIGPLVMKARVRGFVPAVQPRLDVDVLVKGTRLTTWSFTHPADFSIVERSVTIAPDLIEDGWVRLTLAIPAARSPRDLGMSPDDRLLGVGFASAHVTGPVAI